MKDLFKERYRVVQFIVVFFAMVFVARLTYLQLIDKKYAHSNGVRDAEIYPTRGLMYDRNGELIVFNEAIFDIMVIPRMAKKFDTTKLCALLKIPREEFGDRWKKMKARPEYNYYKPTVFMKQVSMQDYAKFQEFSYLFPGFYGQLRTVRNYPHKCAAVVLGDIGEVDEKQIASSDNYYKPGDYVGKNGIEKYYEKELGGVKGVRQIFVDALGREQGGVNETKPEKPAKAGDDLYTTLDIKLQEYGEQLMQNKKGSIVAIEPSTGEVLCLVSSPGYDPNILCGAIRGENFNRLLRDSLQPLFNRATMATYSPGSTFKSLVGLIALNEGVQGEVYTVPCNGFYFFAGLSLRCSHRHPWATNIQYALAQSCNPYFWQTFRNSIENKKYSRIQESYGKWSDYCRSFGLGNKLGIDLPSEARGNIPSIKYLNKIYGERGWHSATIISLGIGQGEILVTPLQLANMYAAIANHGWYYPPHLVKKVLDVSTKKDVQKKAGKIFTKIDPSWFIPVNEGLRLVVESGTATASKVQGISLCGKTGTVQNPHGDNHSMFAGFAPKDSPKIAIAVVVENAGFGATYSAPIASLMVEKYLNDTIAHKRLKLQEKMKNANLIHKYLPTRRPVADTTKVATTH